METTASDRGETRPLLVDFAFRSPESVIGPGESVRLPKLPASRCKAEATIAVVIGQEARKVSESDALSYVFGFAAFLEVFAAGLGRPGVGTSSASRIDTFGPVGP